MLSKITTGDTTSVSLYNGNATIQLVSHGEGNAIIVTGDTFYYTKSDSAGDENEVATLGDIPDVSGFLTTADAVNTYLKKTDASNTYATKTTVGNLSDLTTTAKSSLVAAINEAAASGGSSIPELNFYKEASNYFTFSVAEGTDLIYGSSNLLQFTSAEKGGIINLTDFNTLQIDTDGAFSISTALASVLLENTTSGTGKVTITADSFLWGTKTVATTDAFNSYYTKTNIDNLLASKVDVVSGKQLSTNDYTTAEKTKLAGIAEGANKYVHPSYTPISYTEMAITLGFGEGIDIPLHEVDSTGHVSSTKVLGITLAENAATQSKAGLMSAEDKTKLDNLSFSEMLTETAYNNLTTKDSSKIYFITE